MYIPNLFIVRCIDVLVMLSSEAILREDYIYIYVCVCVCVCVRARARVHNTVFNVASQIIGRITT
jgi:hypothetical protein